MDAVKELRRKAAVEESLAAVLEEIPEKKRPECVIRVINQLRSQQAMFNEAANLVEEDPLRVAAGRLLNLAVHVNNYLRTPHKMYDVTGWLHEYDQILATLPENTEI